MPRRKRILPNGRPRPVAARRLKRQSFEPRLPSAAGINVRSSYEQICVSYFEDEGVAFKYEPVLLLGGKQFRPDFYLTDYDVFLEICGFGHQPYYRDRVEMKKKAYAQAGLRVVFIDHPGQGSLRDKLQVVLAQLSSKDTDGDST